MHLADQEKLKNAKRVREKSAVRRKKRVAKRKIVQIVKRNAKKSVSMPMILLKLNRSFSLKKKEANWLVSLFLFYGI